MKYDCVKYDMWNWRKYCNVYVPGQVTYIRGPCSWRTESILYIRQILSYIVIVSQCKPLIMAADPSRKSRWSTYMHNHSIKPKKGKQKVGWRQKPWLRARHPLLAQADWDLHQPNESDVKQANLLQETSPFTISISRHSTANGISGKVMLGCS